MKYCLSGRQSTMNLKKADEVRMIYNDINKIMDFIEDLPDKTIILEIPKDEIPDWDLMKMYSEKLNNFILAIQNLDLAYLCAEKGIQFYWYYPITTYYELDAIVKLNPSYIFLGAPLCFCLDEVKRKTSIPIRLVANVADEGYIPRENGICGPWIRPEDISAYETYVDTIEFQGIDLQAERALLHVYKDNGNWPGNLNLLLKNLRYDVDNRGFKEDFGSRRCVCKQRCMSTGTCKLCEREFHMLNYVKQHREELKEKYLN